MKHEKYIVIHTMENCQKCKSVYGLLKPSGIPLLLNYDVQDKELLDEFPTASQPPIAELFVKENGVDRQIDWFDGVNVAKINEWKGIVK